MLCSVQDSFSPSSNRYSDQDAMIRIENPGRKKICEAEVRGVGCVQLPPPLLRFASECGQSSPLRRVVFKEWQKHTRLYRPPLYTLTLRKRCGV